MKNAKLIGIVVVTFIFGVMVGAVGSGSSSSTGVTSKSTPESKQTSTMSEPESVATDEASLVMVSGKVEVKSHKTRESYGTTYVVGEVVNNSDKPATFVKITATFYDSEGEVVDTDFTYAGDTSDTPLEPGNTTPFEIIKSGDEDFETYKLDVTWD